MKSKTISDYINNAMSTLETELEYPYGKDKEQIKDLRKAMREAIHDLRLANRQCERVYDYNFKSIY